MELVVVAKSLLDSIFTFAEAVGEIQCRYVHGKFIVIAKDPLLEISSIPLSSSCRGVGCGEALREILHRNR